MKVVKLITPDEVGDRKSSFGSMGGFFKPPMRMKDYMDGYNKEGQEYVDALREFIVEHKIWIGGDEHQYAYIPLFDDDTIATFSFRGWGDLMAAIWSEELGQDMHYMDFYMKPLKPYPF